MRLQNRVAFFLLLLSCGHASFSQDPLTAGSPERLLQAAIDEYGRHAYGPALLTLKQYLATPGASEWGWAEAAYYRAACLIALSQPEGEPAMMEFLGKHPTHPRAPLAMLDVADFYYRKQEFLKASTAYESVDFPGLPDKERTGARFRWGYALFNLRKLDAALDQFNLVKGDPGGYGPAASYYAGFVELSLSKYDVAVTDLQRAADTESYSTAVPYLLASAYYKQKKYDDLLAYVSALPEGKTFSHAAEIRLLEAEAHYRKGNFEMALRGYDAYLERAKAADRSILFRAGYSAFALDKYPQAIAYLNKSASERDSVGGYASYYVGILYLRQGQKDFAFNAFEIARSFSADPRLAEESAFQFAKVAYDLGRAEIAVNEFERFLASYPSSPRLAEVRELLSHAYVNANNFNKALEHIEALSRRSPETDKAYQKAAYLKGAEQFNMRSYPEAIRWFEKSLSFPLDTRLSADAAFWCGEAYSLAGMEEKAIALYQQAMGSVGKETEATRLRARYGLGYAYFNQKHYDRAMVHFREIVAGGKASPNYVDALVRLADCQYVGKSYSEALANYGRAEQSSTPDMDYVLLQSGMVAGIQRKYAQAEAQFGRLISSYPSSRFREEALYQRGIFYFEESRYPEAIQGFTQVISEGKSNRFVSYALMRRAASYYNLKQYDKTTADYVRVVEQYTAHPAAADAMAPLQEALTLTGRSDEFTRYLDLFKAANPDNKNVELLEMEAARNYFYSQNYDKALASLDKFSTSYPESPFLTEANYLKGESHYRLKRWDEALAMYRLVEADASFTHYARVIARLAEVSFRKGDFGQAIQYYHRSAGMSVAKKDQASAWTGLMDSHFQLGAYDSADRYARQLIAVGGLPAPLTNRASLMLGKSAMAKGDFELAKDELLTTLNSARDEYGAEANYLLGEIFFVLKEHKQCYETLVALNRNFAAFDVWVGKAYLLLADNFVATGDYFQARGTLKSLVDNFPLQTVKDQAAERLRTLDEEERKRQSQIVQDTTGG
jgi:tetratricopeptide (TPR) repeat protein